MSGDSGDMKKSLKRKKKRSHNQIMKKMARSRNYAGELETDAYQYMLRVWEIIRNDFSTIDDKLVFANNVYEQTIDHEVDYARNQIGSRVIESLMDYANLETIKRMILAFQNDLRPMCSDRFASHVLQKLICVCTERGSCELEKKSTDLIKDEEKEKYNDMSLKLCKYVINNMEEFAWDTYANHVLRTVFQCLRGVVDKPDHSKKKSLIPLENVRKVDQSFHDLLVDSSKRMHNWPQFLEFGHHELTSGLLQTVLHSLKDVDSDLCSTIVKKIITESFTADDSGNLTGFLETESSARLIEVCLVVSNAKTFKKIYKRFFINKLGELSIMGKANFCVQRLLENCGTKEIFDDIFDEISNHFEMILQRKFTGVLFSVAEACSRLHTKQGLFINCLMKILHCEDAARQGQIARLTASLVNFEKLEQARKEKQIVPLQLHGSLIVQQMLNFNKPIKIVNSLLEADAEELAFIFSDMHGSRIVNCFMSSQYIGEKSREKLAKKLQGYWVELACSTHGSRSLERIWEKAKENQRIIIMEELTKAGESLRSSKTGRIISTKFNVPLFARSRKEWSESQGKDEKTKALFADIVNPDVKSECK
ncbi:nucleolar protein 9 [Leptopilina heterotoma]|uniref:nucleolar protein 9 n=1 Tax=Leptopilina heterotoma TaxID=63436 RepID=UPI001CA894CF|nr:nucleolar protein 9 [Leptopilina heterotoma]